MVLFGCTTGIYIIDLVVVNVVLKDNVTKNALENY